jgi:hypothetical protein
MPRVTAEFFPRGTVKPEAGLRMPVRFISSFQQPLSIAQPGLHLFNYLIRQYFFLSETLRKKPGFPQYTLGIHLSTMKSLSLNLGLPP